MSGDGARKVALVVGAGDATGAAIARRFAREGYAACVTRRTADKLQPLVEEIRAAGGAARAFGSDARKEEQVAELVEQVESQVGPIEVFVFNIGANVPASILEETPRKFFKVWEMACFAAGVQFARAEGIVPAPEANHAVRGAIDEAIRCREEGVSRAILFNLCGHGHFDMQAYIDYFAGTLQDHSYDEADLALALAGLPGVKQG